MGERIEFASNGGSASGYLSRPDRPGPGVIVIQEWWGLVPHIQDVADRFARAGFVALAPDLYHGVVTKSPDEAAKLMMAMRIDEAARDIHGAVDFLLDVSDVSRPKAGIVGFCMGGALALYATARNPKIGACADFYGFHANVKPDLAALEAPVLGIWGGEDRPEAVAEIDRQLTVLGKRHEFHSYPGAKHAFFNDVRPEVHDPKAAADAWDKTVAFFRREL